MTRKDYVVLAAALKMAKPNIWDEGDADWQWRRDVENIIAALRNDNSRFDSDRFRDACWYYN